MSGETALGATRGGAAGAAPMPRSDHGDELLEIRDLRLQFRSMRGLVKALDGVNLTVHEREILGLVGESGCGKTITGLAVLGLLQRPAAEITSGTIRFRGDDLLAKSDKQMEKVRGRQISMVFQDPLASLNPVFGVGGQIEDVVRLHKGVSRAAACGGASACCCCSATGSSSSPSCSRSGSSAPARCPSTAVSPTSR